MLSIIRAGSRLADSVSVRIVSYSGAFLSAGCGTKAHGAQAGLVFLEHWQSCAEPFLGSFTRDFTLSLKTWKESLPREKSGRILACSPQLIGITCPEILSHPAST